jgi:hypothetical protein
MKGILLVLLALTACATPHTRIVYSEAGGILAPITGKTKSCTIYSEEQDLNVEGLTLNSDEDSGSCVGTVKSK